MKSPFRLLMAGVLCLTAALTSAQQQWRKIATFPSFYNLNGVDFSSPDKGTIVGDYGAFFSTTDGGLTWTRPSVAPASSVQAIFWYDDQRGWAVGSAGPDDAFRTVDGGATWIPMSNLPAGSHYSVTFLSPTFGHTVSNGPSALTRDGGATWEMEPYQALMFRDTSTGLAWDSSGVVRTTNGGLTWQRVLNAASVVPRWVTANICIAAGEGGIYRSIDAGQTWVQVSSRDDYYSTATLSPQNIIAWNYVGNVLYSTNAGLTWTEVAGQCPQGILWAVRVNDTTACAISATGDIYRTTNAGASWTAAQDGLGEGPVSWDISFSDGQHGWAVGENGIILKSVDGGATWRFISRGVGFEIDSIKAPSETTFMAAGGGGYFLKTVDGGATYTVKRLKVTGLVFGRDETVEDMDFHPNGLVVAVGYGGVIYRSTDLGENWQSVGFPAISPNIYFYHVRVASATTLYAAGFDADLGHEDSFWKSTDGGQTWNVVYPYANGWHTIDATDANHVWGVTGDRAIHRSVDGGQTWTLRTAQGLVTDIDMVDNEVGYIMGWDGLFQKTTDGGLNWSYRSLEPGMHFLNVHALSRTELWAVGRDEEFRVRAWHSLNGGDTWTSQEVSEWPYSLHRIANTPSGRILFAGFEGQVLEQVVEAKVLPSSYFAETGIPVSGNLASLFASDDDRLVYRSGQIDLDRGTPPVTLRFEATAPVATPGQLGLKVECSGTTSPLSQQLEMYDFAAGQWVTVDTRSTTLTDSQVLVNPPNPARFVQPGTRLMKARLKFSPGPNTGRIWQGRVDQVVWTMAP